MNWSQIIQFLLKQPFHKDFQVEKKEVDHPSQAGFKKSAGEVKGQDADWRKGLPDGSCVHVLEYSTHYIFHRDKRDPEIDPLGHLSEDAPHWLLVIILGIIGALAGIGYALARPKEKSQND